MGDFEILASIPEAVETALQAGLSAHSRAHNVQPYVASPLSLVKRDAAGRIVAGLTGKTFWNWLYIDLLWVDEALRGQGMAVRWCRLPNKKRCSAVVIRPICGPKAIRGRISIRALVTKNSFQCPTFPSALNAKVS